MTDSLKSARKKLQVEVQHATTCNVLQQVAVAKCNATQHHPIGVLHVLQSCGVESAQVVRNCELEKGRSNSQKTTRNGKRCGQTHPRAEATDSDVDLARQLHENDGWGYKRIAKAMEVPVRTVRDWLTYKSR
jgi:hypothetical protein